MEIVIWSIILIVLLLVIVSVVVAEYFFRAVIIRKIYIPETESYYEDINSFMHQKFIKERREWLYSQNIRNIFIKSYDGLSLHATLLENSHSSLRTVICFHGYTGTGIVDFGSMAKFYYEKGFNVLLIDERAHGQSEGKYIGFGILDRNDALKWIEYVIKKFGKDSEIFLHGISMGGATVLMTGGLMLPKNVKGIIDDCGFTSVYEIFSHILKKDYNIPEFPVMFLTEHITKRRAGYGYKDVNTVDVLKKITVPVLFIHGEIDDFVPLWMSEKNYEACVAEKNFFVVKGADHAESYYIDTEGYEAAVSEFTDKYSELADSR